MIVDDHPSMRNAIKGILNAMGIKNIYECSDGLETLKTLNLPIDLVICDIVMPKMDGFEVLSHIRNRPVGSDIPVIMISGDMSKDVIIKASDMGANDYIVKPFKVNSLQTKVQQVLNNFFSPPPLLKALRFGDKFLISQDYEKAIKAYTYAKKIDPGSQRASHALAVTLNSSGHKQEAILELKKNIQDFPSYYRNYSALAEIYLKDKKIPDAISMMIKELELNPKQPDRQVQLADLLASLNKFRQAITHYRHALKDDSKHREALLGLCRVCAQLRDTDKAIYYFKRLRRYYPHDFSITEEAIQWSLGLSATQKIEYVLRDERSHSIQKPGILIQLSKFYFHTGRLDEAQKSLDELFILDRDNLDGLKVQVALDMRSKNLDKALLAHAMIVQKDQSVQSFIAYAECLQMAQKIKESIEVLHKALIQSPNQPNALYLLALAFKVSKQYTKAYYLFRVAKNYGANYDFCDKNIQICKNEVLGRRKPKLKT